LGGCSLSRCYSPAVCGKGIDVGSVDLCSYSNEKLGDSAVHLFPVLKILVLFNYVGKCISII
jgi:hypothetical protein